MSVRIAIVGMACRYPEAASPRELWLNALAQRRSFRRLPDERLRLSDYGTSDASDSDRTYLRRAAVIEGWEFDRARFRVSKSTYRSTDPAHWLALEVATDALEDAGFAAGGQSLRARTGVVVGNSLTGEFSRANGLRLRWPHVRRALESALRSRPGGEWDERDLAEFVASVEQAFKSPFPEYDEDALAGALSNTIAGRICNHHDFHGGGYTVDGACSSSLLAVADAASKLADGELDLALAGGVDLSLDPLELVGFARLGALARDEMRVHDRRPTGFLPGEGCGFVALMREADARGQGRPIRALLEGWGVSSDGSGGLTRPEAGGQVLALERACRRAGVEPSAVTFVETHGTGTAAGDAAELEALTRVRGGGGPPAFVGSLKANIGHAKAAAGVAGLLKAVMAVNRGLLPPSTGCRDPREEVSAPGAALRVVRRGAPWPSGRPRRAGVSAMGFGGINAHAILSGEGSTPLELPEHDEARALRSWQDAELVVLAGRDRQELQGRLARLAAVAGALSDGELGDLAVRAWTELGEGPHRAALVASSPEALDAGLRHLLRHFSDGKGPIVDVAGGRFLADEALELPVTLLFPGQGSRGPEDAGLVGQRWPAVEREFTATLPDHEPGTGASLIAQAEVVSASLAGLRLLGELGIEADAALGHSLGELIALHWAGSIDREALLRLVSARAAALDGLTSDRGAMAAVGAPPAELKGLLGEGVVIACLNGERETILSGTSDAVARAVERLRNASVAAVPLATTHGFHSPCVAGARPIFAEALAGERFRRPARRIVSCVSARELGPDCDLRALLVDHLTSPVRFAEAVDRLASRTGLFVEVGAGTVLSRLVSRLTSVPTLSVGVGGDSLKGALSVAAACFVAGSSVRLEPLFVDRHARSFDPDRRPVFLANPCETLLPPTDGGERPSASTRLAAPEPEPPRPPAGERPTRGSLEVLRELLAERAGLPPETLEPDLRLLADLHLNSLSAARLVAEAARRLSVPPPPALELADATLRQVAAVLDRLERRSGDVAVTAPDGLGAWVRAFVFERVEAPAARRPAGEAGRWRVVGAEHDARTAAVREAAERSSKAGRGVIVCLCGRDDVDDALLLEAVQALREPEAGERLVVVAPARPAAAFARTAHVELRLASTTVIELAPGAELPAPALLLAEAEGSSGFRHLFVETDGRRLAPRLRLLEPSATKKLSPPVGKRDVILVTGGARGIAAECALELARRTSAALALMGRSQPDDPELARALARFESLGSPVRYAAADVTDREAVRSAVETLQSALGPVTVLVHAAGQNVPRALTELDEELLHETLQAKVAGARHVLEALDGERLRAFLPFGSIIGRMGLDGEAHYALANERLRRLTEDWQREHPHCRCACLEWTAWSGVGMAERLAGVGTLAERGVTAITPTVGADWFCRLVAAPPEQASVLITGRWGAPEALPLAETELPLLRFLEKPRLHVPAVELVVDSELSAESDPYLDDHVYDGQRLLPAVMGLEALSQAASALHPDGRLTGFRDVRFERPVLVPGRRPLVLRLSALRLEDGDVEVSLRSAETGFAVDHFRARCVFDRPLEPADAKEVGAGRATPLGLDPRTELYGRLLFQSGRFRRIEAHSALSSRHCEASLGEPGGQPWFGRYLPQRLLLGDPGGRDALLHAIQACHPHATLLPAAVESIELRGPGRKPLRRVRSEETAVEPRALVHEATGFDGEGLLLERWKGLRLVPVDGSENDGPWPAVLAGPVVERRFADFFPGTRLSVTLTDQARGTVAEGAVRADGRPLPREGFAVARSHCGGWTLEVVGEASVGCDLEPAEALAAEEWPSLLGAGRESLVRELARAAGEPRELAARRCWCILESLRKADLPLSTPLVFVEAGRDGWLSLRAGSARVACGPIRLSGCEQVQLLALLLAES